MPGRLRDSGFSSSEALAPASDLAVQKILLVGDESAPARYGRLNQVTADPPGRILDSLPGPGSSAGGTGAPY